MRKNFWNHMFSSIMVLSWIIGLVVPTTTLAAPSSDFVNEPVTQTPNPTPLVESELQSQISDNPQVGYLIYLRDKADLSTAATLGWEERGWFVMNTLQATAKSSQANVITYLESHKVDYESFWIDNIIQVNSSDLNTFYGLLNFPEIEALRSRRTMQVIEPDVVPAPEAPSTVEPNIAHVGAPAVWALGINGDGMTVSSIDTGVRYTHDALEPHYRGNLGNGTFEHNYNWFDPYGDHPTSPADDNGHGSHTMGTMIGDDGGANQIGMAPGAEWMACRGCNTSSCTDTALLACAQFIAAPTNLAGTSPDPAKRPNSVNNSWGDCSTYYDNWYQGVVNSWQAAGIYPVFSNGNSSNCGYSSPPGLNTVGNPARYGNVTGVGATTRDTGQYATFSNWGPTDNPDTVNPNPDNALGAALKPQVMAPGSNIRSSVNTSDSAYQGGWSGTSMSAPHVTALVALMWQAAPCLVGEYATTENIIENTATPIPYDSDGNPPPPEGNVPNYATGHGEINALAAVEEAISNCGDSILTGTVTDFDTTDPIVGALVIATNGTDTRQTRTDINGDYSLTLYAGLYTITTSAFGYLPMTIENVNVSGTTTRDITLHLAPNYTLSGVVSDETTGWPLYASINIDGYPNNPIWTDPETGYYSINLPAGVVYHLDVSAFSGGYNPESADTDVLTSNQTVNITLLIDELACSAPGYNLDVTGVYEPFSATTIPAGWTVIKNSGTCTWDFDNPGERTNATGGSGNFAIADSDACGSGTTMNTDLLSPIMDVSDLLNLNLSFDYDYNNLSSSEVAAVDLSDDGGATWTNLLSWNSDHPGPANFSQDVTAIAGGSTQAQIRFHYVAPGWDWWWQVDNVFMGEKTCVPLPGGLVVGTVSDLNNGEGLVGATVANNAGYSVETVATPLDGTLGDGYYTLFSPTGVMTFTASLDQYNPDTALVNVVAGDTVRQDFQLASGFLTYTPDAVDINLEAGGVATTTMVLTNSGQGSASFELLEINRGFVPFSLPHEPYQPKLDPALIPDLFSTAGYSSNVSAPAGNYEPTGDVLLAVDDGTSENALGLTAGGQFLWLNRFTPDPSLFPFTLDEISLPMESSVPEGGNLQLVVWEDVDGDDDPGTGANLLHAQDVTILNNDGVTWNVYPLTSPVLLTGPGDVLIGVVNRAGTESVGMFPAAFDENSASQERSWVGIYSANPPNPPTLPADSAFATLDEIGYPGNWTLRASGFTGGADVEWLSEDVISGTLSSNTSQEIVLTLDATGLYPGVYDAQINVANDTPHDVPNLPVQLTVTVPSDWGKITGSVETTGYCDDNPAFLEGVDVVITTGLQHTYNLTTDENGAYGLWIPVAENPLTIIVSPSGYAVGQATGVMLYGQGTTTQDFSLRLLQPCVTTVPSSMIANLSIGQNTDRSLRINNQGGATTPYTITEQYVSSPMLPIMSQPVVETSGNTNVVTIGDLALRTDSNSQVGQVFIPTPLYRTNASVTLTHSASQSVISGNSVSCNAGGLHADNHYLRVFDLPSFGINGPFEITNVEIGIEMASGASGTQPVEMRLFTLNGAFIFANLTPIGNASVSIPNQTGTIFNVPVSGIAPAGSKLVVDFFTPSGQAAGNGLFVGSNDLGETAPSYLAAADCGIPEPATTASIGFPEMMIVMNVTGNTGGTGADVPWISEIPVTGTVSSDSFVFSTVTFDANAVPVPGEYKANVVIASDDQVNPSHQVMTTMNVSAPASWGVLQGTIETLGYCDTNPADLGEVIVTLIDSQQNVRTAVTDANGFYKLWLNSDTNPHTLYVSPDGQIPDEVSNIEVNGLGAVTTQDVSLRSDESCFSYTPDAIEVYTEWGSTTSEVLTINNSGAASTVYTITESVGGFVPMAPDPNSTGGPDAFGYTFKDNTETGGPVYSWIDATDGTLLTYPSDDGEANISSPFPLMFYANDAVTNLRVGKNGGIMMNVTTGDVSYSNTAMSSAPNNFVAFLWDDAGAAGSVYWKVIGSAPLRQLVVEFFNVPRYNNIGAATYEVIFNEDGSILMQYLDMDYGNTTYNYGLSATVGIRGADAANSLQYSYNQAIINNGLAICFAAPGTNPNCSQVFDPLTWVDEVPKMGMLLADTGTQDVIVSFDAGVDEITQPGTYDGILRLNSQDRSNPEYQLPVIMHVQPPATFGKLNGTIKSLGYCDLENNPLDQASVTIRDNQNAIVAELKTDSDGYYQYWVNWALNPFSVEVTYANHVPESVGGILITPGQTSTADVDLRWLKPCLSNTPASLSTTLELGNVVTQTFTLNNSGAAAGNFTVRDSNADFTPVAMSAAADVLVVNDGGSNASAVSAFTSALTNLGNTFLVVSSSSLTGIPANLPDYPVVIYAGVASSGAEQNQLMAYLNGGGSLLIADNDLGYSAASSVFYQTYLQATYYTDAGSDGMLTGFNLMNGLSVDISSDPYPDSFSLGPEAVGIFRVVPGDGRWGGSLIERMGYKAIYLAWDYYYAGGSTVGDPIETTILAHAMDILLPSVPWLNEVPGAGSVAADTGSQVIKVAFDAGVPEVTQPGIYTGDVIVSSDDPENSPITVPTTMNVTGPASWSKLEGIVTSLGYCDNNPVPLDGATVTVVTSADITYTLTTDAFGHYQRWMDAVVNSPVTITVDVAEHTPGLVTDLPLVPGQTVTQNIDLRLMVPCASVEPNAFEVTLEQGDSLTLPLNIVNDGAGELTWAIHETTGTVQLQSVTPIIGLVGSKDKQAPSIVSRPGGPVHSFYPMATVVDEGFEGGIVPPSGWSLEQSESTETWTIGNLTPYEGTYYGDVVYDSNLVPQDEVLLSPEMILESGVLDFWSFGSLYWCRDTYDNCDLNIWIVVGEWDGGTGDDIFVGTVDDDWTANWTWANSTFDLTPLLPDSPVRIAFQYIGLDGAEVALDGILLDGELGSLWTEVPWVTEVPTHGVIGPDSSFDVDIKFDSSGLTANKCYTASLGLVHDDTGLESPVFIPLELCVVHTEYGVNLEPEATTGTGLPGDVKTYTLQLTNTGNVADSFEIDFSNVDPDWVVELPVTSFNLDAGISVNIQVKVTIPSGALDGEFDVATITATSTHDTLTFDDVAITTTVKLNLHHFFLPLINNK